MKELADSLKKYRERKSLNQQSMAKLLGIGYRTYQDIEKTGKVKKIKDLSSINKLLATPNNTQLISHEALEKEEQPYENTLAALAKAILQHAETINSQQSVIRRYIEKEPDISEAKNGKPSERSKTKMNPVK